MPGPPRDDPETGGEGEFRPFPLLRNPHVQTILGSYLPGPEGPEPDRRYVVPLPDGDAVVLHENTPPGWRAGGTTALLLHGLTGSYDSPHIRRLAQGLLARGVQAVRMDLRGAGAGMPLARKSYNAGRSEDVRVALEYLVALRPTSPLLLVGVSLGGNIALKLAGEAADLPVPGLVRVGALAPPIDLARCAELLVQPRNRIYEQRFARELVAQARERQRYFPDLAPLNFPRRMTVRLFDDLYTAPRGGYADTPDYYRRASSAPLIPRIQLPTFILTARDDPFIAAEPFEELVVPRHIHVRILPHGGHVGFLGWDGSGGIRWAERRLVDWLTNRG